MHDQLSPETSFLIDFNLSGVAAALGLAVPPKAAAEMMGITEDEFCAYTASVETEVNATAAGLLANGDLARVIDQLAIPAGGTMMAVGDSITTYRRSYARLFAAMIAIRRPDDHIEFLNVAQSGYTSTHGLEGVYTQFLGRKPDWVSIDFGVNDCKLFGEPNASTLVSPDEYRNNMSAIVQAFLSHTQARPVLITPSPIVEDVVNTNPDFQAMRMAWSNSDISDRAAVVRDLAQRHELPLVDLWDVFGTDPDPSLYLDGLHPGPDGHKLVARALLRSLAEL